MSKRGVFLIGAGFLNITHAGIHVLQFIQSMFLISYSHGNEHNDILHNPWMSLVWALVGLITLLIGIKDYRHHNKCDI